MNAVELLKSGRLSEARGKLTEALRTAPADQESRDLFFQVLAFYGEWEKAERHLDLLDLQAPGRKALTSSYRNLICAEKARGQVHRNERLPDFLAEPPSFLQEFLEARSELGRGNSAPLVALLPAIDESTGQVSGTADGVPFQGMLDLDATLLPFLEVFIHDRYLWFPVTALRELAVQAPVSFLDLLWAPARIVTWDGLTVECVLPVLYPGSGAHADDQVRLGRLTDWEELCAGFSRGVGQHLFLLGDEEKALLEVREITFNPLQES